jgi:AcrR family transcriptional regulator
MSTRTARGPHKPTPKRFARREALLAEGARQINARGAGAVQLNEVADRIGLSRNALYYYVDDRADLVFRAYQRSCEATADDLAVSGEEGDDPVARIRAFIERTLAYQRPETAVLSDIDFLPDAQAGLVRSQQLRNVATLAGWVEDAVRVGRFRACDPALVAQSLFGQVGWSLLSLRWLAQRDGPRTRARMAAAVSDLLVHGIAAPGTDHARCDIDVNALVARPYNAFDREEATAQKVALLAAAASNLFNRKGIDGASLDDVGAEVGATKGAIYHYFQDKTALVVTCYERAFDLYEAIMAQAREHGRSGFERAIAILHMNVQAMAGPLSPMILHPGFLNLPEAVRAQFIARARRLRMGSERLLRQGEADGSCRPLDAVYTALVSAGIFFWLPKWQRQFQRPEPKALADTLTEIFALGIGVPER